MVFWKCMKIVWLEFFQKFDAGSCMISIFGVGKCKISIFGLWRSTRGYITFPGFLLFLIGFLYKTAQKPLKNRSNVAWKTVQKSLQEMSGFWAVFQARFERFFQQNRPNCPSRLNRLNSSNLAEKPLKSLISWAVFEWELDPNRPRASRAFDWEVCSQLFPILANTWLKVAVDFAFLEVVLMLMPFTLTLVCLM